MNRNRDEPRVRSFTIDAIKAAEGDENPRRFTVSFSSEEPYRRWFGNEILDHSDGACDLTRLNEVGVVLFNHDTDYVIGRVERAWLENRRGQAVIIFDDDEKSDIICQKVNSGTLKTTSVRYKVDVTEDVKAGVTTPDGFIGPCTIVRKWTPLEVSIVSVPADASVGVGRSAEITTAALDVYERQIKANKNYLVGGI